jgi:hypothetical protein
MNLLESSTRLLMFRQYSGAEIDPDTGHDEASQLTQEQTHGGNDNDSQQSETEEILVVQVGQPGFPAGEPPAIGDDDDGFTPARGSGKRLGGDKQKGQSYKSDQLC